MSANTFSIRPIALYRLTPSQKQQIPVKKALVGFSRYLNWGRPKNLVIAAGIALLSFLLLPTIALLLTATPYEILVSLSEGSNNILMWMFLCVLWKNVYFWATLLLITALVLLILKAVHSILIRLDRNATNTT